MTLDTTQLNQAADRAIATLLSQRHDEGHWEGRLSSSALSTATAMTALALLDLSRGEIKHQDKITQGAQWLIRTQNGDGAWGDTDKSSSNISTTMLVWAALGLLPEPEWY